MQTVFFDGNFHLLKSESQKKFRPLLSLDHNQLYAVKWPLTQEAALAFPVNFSFTESLKKWEPDFKFV